MNFCYTGHVLDGTRMALKYHLIKIHGKLGTETIHMAIRTNNDIDNVNGFYSTTKAALL